VEVLLEYAPDLDHQLGIASHARRRRFGLCPAMDMLVVVGRDDLQCPADRLDPVLIAVRIDEADHGFA
jgi:hypothetical protein